MQKISRKLHAIFCAVVKSCSSVVKLFARLREKTADCPSFYDKLVTRLKSCDAINGLTTREETAMSLGSHITELRRKHESLAAEVERAARSPASHDLEIVHMKKQKLRLKEQIHRLPQA
jgi:hypothetical protein